jgi:cytochrome b involved in lipid metabolism
MIVPGDAWIILNNQVFEVTSVLNWHPGGKNAIMNYAGRDSMDTTIQYNRVHDSWANTRRDEFYLGIGSQKGIDVMKKMQNGQNETEKGKLGSGRNTRCRSTTGPLQSWRR